MTRPTFDHWQIGRILSSFFSPSLCVYLCLHVPFVLLRRQYIRVYEQSFASTSVNSFSFFNAFLQKQNNERVLSLSLCLSLVSLVRYTERHNCKFVSSLYLRFLTVTLRCPPFSVSSFSSCIRFLLISHVCTEIEFPRGRRWRGSARRRKNVGCAHSCDHGTSWSWGGDISTRYGSDTRFRASLGVEWKGEGETRGRKRKKASKQEPGVVYKPANGEFSFPSEPLRGALLSLAVFLPVELQQPLNNEYNTPWWLTCGQNARRTMSREKTRKGSLRRDAAKNKKKKEREKGKQKKEYMNENTRD